MTIEKFLQVNYNYNPDAKNVMQGYIDNWKAWYKGNVRDFHNYFIYNGKNKIKQKRFSMNMAKTISEDWSDILWSEKCKISLKNEQNQAKFNELINSLDLNLLINQSIEKSGAVGTCANVVGVYDIEINEQGMTMNVSNAKTRVDVVDVDWIYPLSWNNKEIKECAFASVEYIAGGKYIVLSVHKIADDGNYHIYNHMFKETNGVLSLIEQFDGTAKDFNTMGTIKWFSVFKPLLTNNLFDNNPFGIPHYANAIDSMMAVDISFDALKNEIKDGRKRIFARADMFNYDDGQQRLVFDPNDATIYQLPNGATKDDLIQSDSDVLRTGQLIESLNTNLNILGSKVGFGDTHYNFNGSTLNTATEVVSSNSKMFRRKKKLEIGYESSIYDLVKAICYASSKFGEYDIDNEDMVITFDDSIIEDKEAESNRALRELSVGVMSKSEYRQVIYGETKEVADANIKLAEEENPSINQILGE